MANETRVTIAPHRSFVCWLRNSSLAVPILVSLLTLSLASLSLLVEGLLAVDVNTFIRAGAAVLIAIAIVWRIDNWANKKANERGGPYQRIFVFLVEDWEQAQNKVGIKPAAKSLRWLATKNPSDIVGWSDEERMHVLTEYAREYQATLG